MGGYLHVLKIVMEVDVKQERVIMRLEGWPLGMVIILIQYVKTGLVHVQYWLI